RKGRGMKRFIWGFLVLAALSTVVMLAGAGGVAHVPRATSGQLGIDDEMNNIQERLISGFAAFELAKSGNDTPSSIKADNYSPRGSGDCASNISSNIKVNQNCLNLSDPDLQGRAQAQNETSIAVDPNQPNHIIASYNDYRRGDGNCYGSYSLDKGRTWNDTTVPMSFTRGKTFGNTAR